MDSTSSRVGGGEMMSSSRSRGGTSDCDLQSYHPDLCLYISLSCESESRINYLNLFFCSGVPRWLMALLFSLLMGLFFLLLGFAASSFLVPCLNTLCNNLNIPPDIAGLTFMALANGAPDIMSTYAAVSQQAFGISVGELLGAGVFVQTVVLASVALLASDVVLKKVAFLRDTAFYVFGVILFLFLVRDGSASVWDSCIMLGYYLLYLIVAVFGPMVSRRLGFTSSSSELPPPPSDSEPIALEEVTVEEVEDLMSEPQHTTSSSSPSSGREVEGPKDLFLSVRSEILSRSHWQRFLYVGSNVISLPLYLSCPLPPPPPSSTSEPYPRFSLAVSFFLCPTLVLFGFSLVPLSFMNVSLCLLSGLFLSSTVFFVFSRRPSPRVFPVFSSLLSLFGFLISLFWVASLARELVSMLRALGSAAHISDVVLGATVLAWGSSIGDAVSNVALARAQQAQMCMAAVFGGPLFNLLLGSAVSLLAVTLRTYPQPYRAPLQMDSMVSAMFLVTNVIVVVVVVSCTNYTVPKKLAVWLLLWYALYDTLLILLGVGVVSNKIVN